MKIDPFSLISYYLPKDNDLSTGGFGSSPAPSVPPSDNRIAVAELTEISEPVTPEPENADAILSTMATLFSDAKYSSKKACGIAKVSGEYTITQITYEGCTDFIVQRRLSNGRAISDSSTANIQAYLQLHNQYNPAELQLKGASDTDAQVSFTLYLDHGTLAGEPPRDGSTLQASRDV